MSLPGTSHDNSVSGKVRVSPNMSLSSGSGRFTKVHKFLSYALDEKIHVPTDQKELFLVTGLLDIPWQYLFMYLTRSEYDLLPDGAYVKLANCKIWFRNVRQAFETNFATLNQSIDVQTATGLNHIWEGMNGNVTCSSKLEISNFKPLVTAKEHYAPLVKEMYGVPENDELWSSAVPKSIIGSPIIPTSYYAMYHKYKTSGTERSETKYENGWHNLSNVVNLFDSQHVRGKMIIDKTYIPLVGFIKKPHAVVTSHAIVTPQNIVRPSGNLAKYRVGPHPKFHRYIQDTLTDAQAIDKSLYTSDTSESPASTATFEYYNYIEKSQYMRPYNKPNMIPQTQPWIHVGIKPVPAITFGSTTRHVANIQGYFEVHCSLDVGYEFPTQFPFSKKPNVPPGNQVFCSPNVPSESKPYYLGLMRQ